MAFSSDMAASYAIPVRRASVLPAASFRFGLTTDTLAVRLMVPAVGPIEDFHLQVSVPCRAHHKKSHRLAVAFEVITFFTLPHDPSLFGLFHRCSRTEFFVAGNGIY